jgi:hypothetical protein
LERQQAAGLRTMRHVSTLQPDNQFKLDPKEQNAGFMGLYRDKHTSKTMNGAEFLWQTFAMLMMPSISGLSFSLKGLSKEFRENVSKNKQRTNHKSVLYRLGSEKRFIIQTATLGCTSASLPNVVSTLLDVYQRENSSTFGQVQRDLAIEGKSESDYVAGRNWDTVFTGEQLASRLNVNQRAREIIRTAVESARLELASDVLMLQIRFSIDLKAAEFLNQTAFNEIKNGNFYAFLFPWISSNLGSDPNAEVAPYCVPMAKIATRVAEAANDKSLKITTRAGEDQIIVDHLGQYLWIPDIDNTKQYEDQLTTFGQRPDASYSYDQGQDQTDFKIGDPANAARKKLPANIPLLTDWVNRKFAYVNSAGRVDVIDLSLATPLNSGHIKKLLDQTYGQGSGLVLGVTLARSAKPDFMRSVAEPTGTEMPAGLWQQIKNDEGAADFLDQAIRKIGHYRKKNNLPVSEFFFDKKDNAEISVRYLTPTSPIQELRFIGRILREAQQVLISNLPVVFSQYSVVSTIQALANLMVFNKYSEQYDTVEAKDKADRKDYIEQGVDPSYVPDAIANFRKDSAFLPHQARVDNRFRRGPKFGIIEVDAGGGKTMQVLTQILRELKAKRCVKPIIMCPSHLVSSYVHEAVYFTEGKVNVIPLTNMTMRQHGEDRLAQMIVKAPINTIFLTDFDFVKNKGTRVAYGNKMVTVYKNAEFLRRFEFDLVCIDECHYLRNQTSLRTRAAQSVVNEIPMKRIASGTFIADTLVDVAGEFALLDPTVFGTREQFIREYAAEIKGEKVIAWKRGAEAMIRRKMAEHAVVAVEKRKAWAALLPFPVEEFFGVELTANQRALYESILTETLEKLREAIANDPELRDALESNDDTKVEELAAKLRAYLARLEAFLSSPESDKAGKDFLLLPEDQVSPKVLKIYERIQEHTEKQIPGKILIFTNYVKAAESVYNNAPPDIKKRMILYTAANKAECKVMFETMPQKDIMVGVETSMNTGLNLQFVSRLIRMETVWTPGSLEQGNARVNRPNVKKKETRANIYFDWIIINRTIDVTKISRLVSKFVSKTKFDEHDNPAYEAVESLPQIPMTMETIEAHNDFNDTLRPYLETYEQVKQIQRKDFADYRAMNEGKLDPIPIKAEGLLKDSKLMTRVPYIPDMEVYGEEELGLIRYDQFIRQDITTLDDDDGEGDDDEGDDETDAKAELKAALAEERQTMVGMAVHTQWGDGEITGLGRKRIRVKFADGTRKGMSKMAAYVITRSTTNVRDMRDALLKQVGAIPLDEPYDVPVEQGPASKVKGPKSSKVIPEEVELSAEFDITVINDYLALAYRSDNKDDRVIDMLSNVGFIKSFEYFYSWLKGPNNLIQLFKDWSKAGFVVDKKTSLLFQNIFAALKGNKAAGTKYGFATQFELKNWLRSTIKPTSDPNEIHPYPISQDGMFYIALPVHGQPGTRRAIKHQPMAIRWKQGGGDDEVLRFVTRSTEIIEVLKQIQDLGITITNLDELKDQYKQFKQHKPRD